VTAAAERLALERLHGFVAALAAAGVPAGTQKETDFLRAVAATRPRSPRELYWTARVTLVQRLGEIPVFDEVFEAWFGESAVSLAPPAPPRPRPRRATALRGAPGAAGGDAPGRRRGAGRDASREDSAGRYVFPAASAEQRRLLAEARAALAEELPAVHARRRRAARRAGALDLRRVLHGARRHGGEVVRLCWRDRPRRPRRVLLLVDVSGSLRQTSGDALRFAHALVRVDPRSEVYTFGTRLTRVTSQLRRRDVDAALAALAGVVLDANGGTRIGAALAEFLRDGRRAGLARGALVVVLSDGLERGDPAAMASAVAQLSRLAHRVVWWSPLACDPGYRPVTRAMAAVLGDLDDLAGVRGLADAVAAVRRLRAVEAAPRRAVARSWAAGGAA
jgi:uncharacterized protein with von Willebrand factor type A (vWA) domain